MSELQTKRCLACEAGIPPLSKEKVSAFLLQVPEWKLSGDEKKITRRYAFKNFYKTMGFVNAVAWIANQEGHHPDMEVGFNYCVVNYSTHAIDGLTENDFICAAKVDGLGVG
jgi:4a-hydroxytetrahydrobiopterin dehydratase